MLQAIRKIAKIRNHRIVVENLTDITRRDMKQRMSEAAFIALNSENFCKARKPWREKPLQKSKID